MSAVLWDVPGCRRGVSRRAGKIGLESVSRKPIGAEAAVSYVDMARRRALCWWAVPEVSTGGFIGARQSVWSQLELRSITTNLHASHGPGYVSTNSIATTKLTPPQPFPRSGSGLPSAALHHSLTASFSPDRDNTRAKVTIKSIAARFSLLCRPRIRDCHWRPTAARRNNRHLQLPPSTATRRSVAKEKPRPRSYDTRADALKWQATNTHEFRVSRYTSHGVDRKQWSSRKKLSNRAPRRQAKMERSLSRAQKHTMRKTVLARALNRIMAAPAIRPVTHPTTMWR